MKKLLIPFLGLFLLTACQKDAKESASDHEKAMKANATNVGRPFTITLTGAVEVPRPGDPDGIGTAELYLNPGQGTITYTLKVSGIEPARAAHIHEAPAGNAGPIVVGLSAPTNGTSSGTITVSRELILEIIRNPENYYVNVHNAIYPGGALRGQLTK